MCTLYLIALITMEAREARAICQWLGWSAGSPEAARLLSDPLRVLLAHIDTLPPHLQAPFAAVTTPQQRGASARFRTRWRNWAQQTRPEELSIEQARQRDPLSYKDIVGEQSGRRSIPQDQPASDLSDSNAVTRPPDVAAKPRFAALVRDFDEQDRLQLLARQQQHRMETTAEVEEEEEEEEGSDDGGMAANAHESGSTAREQTTGSLQREGTSDSRQMQSPSVPTTQWTHANLHGSLFRFHTLPRTAEADFVNEVLAGFVRGSVRQQSGMGRSRARDISWADRSSTPLPSSLRADYQPPCISATMTIDGMTMNPITIAAACKQKSPRGEGRLMVYEAVEIQASTPKRRGSTKRSRARPSASAVCPSVPSTDGGFLLPTSGPPTVMGTLGNPPQ